MKPIDLDIDDYKDLVREFHAESDRAAAIVAGSFLENYLAKFLKSFMIDDEKLVGPLFDGMGPFSGLKQRIKTLRAFDLISEKHFKNLEVIANVRNHFAHHPKTVSFCDDKVGSWVRSMSTWDIYKQAEGEAAERLRHTYLTCISLTISVMHNNMLKRAELNKKRHSDASGADA